MNRRTGGPVSPRAAVLAAALLFAPSALAGGAAASRLASTRMTLRGSDLPLANVLNQIARSAQLALVVDKDVRLDRVVASPQLDDQPLDTALAVVLTPLGYSYGVDEERKHLRVFVYETRTFKVSMPTVVQDWTASISNAGGSGAGAGGDVLGARVGLSARTDTTGIWEEVEKSLGRLMGGEAQGQQQGQGGEAKAGAPRDMGAFSVNRVAGFVTVRALPAVMPSVESYFDALNEEMGREVSIEAKVLQVDFNDSKSASVDWNLLAARMGQNAFIAGGMPGSNLVSAGTTPFLRVSGRAGDAFIRALEEQGKVEVMAQPTLALGNNLPAIIELARVQAYVSQQQTTVVQGTSAAQVTVQTSSLSDGLIISMLPRVLPDGEVSLALATVLQDVLEIRRENFSQSFVELPRTARRSYNGVVRARLNETLVIGGLITTRKEESRTGLPFLSRIPVLGFLFGGNRYVDRKSELILAVTPREVKGVPAVAPVPVRLEPGND
ncbi:MAG: hypothetical protein RL653_696 [Pseudomonadota bacterium]